MSTTFAIREPGTERPIEHLGAVAYGPQKVKHPYYDYGQLLSHHGAFNFLIGARGRGKSYGAKRLALRKNIKNGDLFIYLRRFKEELISRETFFADIQHEFPDWDFRANGNTFEKASAHSRDDKKRDWETIGYAIALSTSQKQKSIAFPRVKLIIFDEFILEKSALHYLPDEATIFTNFYSTVDRYQDKTTVLFLANSVSISNPYFIEFGILPTPDTDFLKLKNGYIVVHFDHNEDFSDSVLNTRFGQFIKDTDYAKYAVGNAFADNNLLLVEAKNPNAKHMFNLETRAGSFSLWQDPLTEKYFAVARMPAGQLYLTLLPENMGEDRTLVFNNSPIIVRIKAAFQNKKLWFDSPATRNLFLDLYKVSR